jgi:hypothetical protein
LLVIQETRAEASGGPLLARLNCSRFQAPFTIVNIQLASFTQRACQADMTQVRSKTIRARDRRGSAISAIADGLRAVEGIEKVCVERRKTTAKAPA